MSNIGFQISLELSRIKPIGDVADNAYRNIIDYARRARLSGSDIVVEEDLTTIFGRVRISSELEAEYKEIVKIQHFTPLYKGCEIWLDAGAGPTVQNALKFRAYMITVLQLSMLIYFHGRGLLAEMLSKAITKRFESRIEDALPDLGREGIAKVLEAISSQTCAFGWHVFSQKVEERLRSLIPNFEYRPEYSRLPSDVILGLMDFFFITQSFPDERRLSLTTEVGCIPFIIWAHHILEFTVIISESFDDIIFGDISSTHACAHVRWSGKTSTEIGEASIRLHERDMTLILEIAPQEDLRSRILAEERHPVLGYGTTCLKRSLNTMMITHESESIYEDSVKFVVAWAIRISKSIRWEGRAYERRSMAGVEIWRIIKVGKLLFEGLPMNVDEIENYVGYSGQDEVGKDLLPPVFDSYLERAEKAGIPSKSYIDHLQKQFRFQVKLIIALSFVVNIEDCASMPIIMDHKSFLGSWFSQVLGDFQRPTSNLLLRPTTLPKVITRLLTSARGDDHDDWDRILVEGIPFLWNDFGWSIFLDTLGDKDPSEVRLGFVHVKMGVPTCQGTGERRTSLVDGDAAPLGKYPDSPPLQRGDRYTPRAAASITRRQEFWAVQPDCFALSIMHSVRPDSERLKHSGVQQPFEIVAKYADMSTVLLGTPVTPPCEHTSSINKSDRSVDPRSLRLGPDAVVLLGWSDRNLGQISERVLILLTKGIPALRWQAMKNFSSASGYRQAVLVTDDCCEECALKSVSSTTKKWALVL